MNCRARTSNWYCPSFCRCIARMQSSVSIHLVRQTCSTPTTNPAQYWDEDKGVGKPSSTGSPVTGWNSWGAKSRIRHPWAWQVAHKKNGAAGVNEQGLSRCGLHVQRRCFLWRRASCGEKVLHMKRKCFMRRECASCGEKVLHVERRSRAVKMSCQTHATCPMTCGLVGLAYASFSTGDHYKPQQEQSQWARDCVIGAALHSTGAGAWI